VGLALWLALSSGAAARTDPADSSPPSDSVRVTSTPAGLSVVASGASPEAVVQRIGEVAGFRVRTGRSLAEEITLDFSAPTAEAAVRRVLGSASVVMLHGPPVAGGAGRITEVWIYGPRGGTGLLSESTSVPQRRRAASPHSGDPRRPIIAALLDDLHHPDPEVRVHVVTTLGLLGGPAATLRLGETVLGDAVPEVRLQALRELETLGTDEARVFLEQALDDPDPQVNATAADLLTRLP
jgi:hypothetical protein